MSDEIWKDIPGYEGQYQASNMGHIRSVDRYVNGKNHYTGLPFKRKIHGQVLHPGRYCKSGHVSVVLGHKTNGKPVHQLIARTFLGECPEGKEVLHNNGNPTDNRIDNLRYGTRTENILDVYHIGRAWRKLTIEDVEYIRFCLAVGIPKKQIAEAFHVSEATIYCINSGRTYSWLQ